MWIMSITHCYNTLCASHATMKYNLGYGCISAYYEA